MHASFLRKWTFILLLTTKLLGHEWRSSIACLNCLTIQVAVNTLSQEAVMWSQGTNPGPECICYRAGGCWGCKWHQSRPWRLIYHGWYGGSHHRWAYRLDDPTQLCELTNAEESSPGNSLHLFNL